jgi:hypothetical protein
MMSDSPRATASDSLSGTDVMAAMGMAQSQAGFGMAAFCGKHELSQNDKQKAINYLMQFAHKVSGKYRGVAKLEGNTKAKVLQVLATFAYADYCRSAATPGQDAEIAMVQAVRLILPKQSCGESCRERVRKMQRRRLFKDASKRSISRCDDANPKPYPTHLVTHC